jgi:hypothetical protein
MHSIDRTFKSDATVNNVNNVTNNVKNVTNNVKKPENFYTCDFTAYSLLLLIATILHEVPKLEIATDVITRTVIPCPLDQAPVSDEEKYMFIYELRMIMKLDDNAYTSILHFAAAVKELQFCRGKTYKTLSKNQRSMLNELDLIKKYNKKLNKFKGILKPLKDVKNIPQETYCKYVLLSSICSLCHEPQTLLFRKSTQEKEPEKENTEKSETQEPQTQEKEDTQELDTQELDTQEPKKCNPINYDGFPIPNEPGVRFKTSRSIITKGDTGTYTSGGVAFWFESIEDFMPCLKYAIDISDLICSKVSKDCFSPPTFGSYLYTPPQQWTSESTYSYRLSLELQLPHISGIDPVTRKTYIKHGILPSTSNKILHWLSKSMNKKVNIDDENLRITFPECWAFQEWVVARIQQLIGEKYGDTSFPLITIPCYRPGCKEFNIQLRPTVNTNKKYTCKGCNIASFCVFCCKPDHGLSKCNITQDESTQYYISQNTIKCPGCSVPTEKNQGCNHITCKCCKTHWCYLCSDIYTPETLSTHYKALNAYSMMCKGLERKEREENERQERDEERERRNREEHERRAHDEEREVEAGEDEEQSLHQIEEQSDWDPLEHNLDFLEDEAGDDDIPPLIADDEFHLHNVIDDAIEGAQRHPLQNLDIPPIVAVDEVIEWNIPPVVAANEVIDWDLEFALQLQQGENL